MLQAQISAGLTTTAVAVQWCENHRAVFCTDRSWTDVGNEGDWAVVAGMKMGNLSRMSRPFTALRERLHDGDYDDSRRLEI